VAASRAPIQMLGIGEVLGVRSVWAKGVTPWAEMGCRRGRGGPGRGPGGPVGVASGTRRGRAPRAEWGAALRGGRAMADDEDERADGLGAWTEEEGPGAPGGPPSMDVVELDGGASDGAPAAVEGGGAGDRDPQVNGKVGDGFFPAGQMVLDELGAFRSKAVSRLLKTGAEAQETWGDVAGPRLITTGTAGCSCCCHPEHDRLMFSYWRGEVSADEVGHEVGVTGDRWTQHQREHVPNYQTLRELARIGAGADMRRLLVDLRDEALRATDEFDRLVLLRSNIVLLKLTQLALVSRGVTASAQQAHAIRSVTHELETQGRELWKAEREAAAWAADMRRERQGDGWAALDKFKRDLNDILRADPELGARVNDLLEARGDADVG